MDDSGSSEARLAPAPSCSWTILALASWPASQSFGRVIAVLIRGLATLQGTYSFNERNGIHATRRVTGDNEAEHMGAGKEPDRNMAYPDPD